MYRYICMYYIYGVGTSGAFAAGPRVHYMLPHVSFQACACKKENEKAKNTNKKRKTCCRRLPHGPKTWLSCHIHTHTPALKSYTSFLLHPFVLHLCSTDCLRHGHGYECHSPFIIGNCGTSVVTPFDLTPPGSCQVAGHARHLIILLSDIKRLIVNSYSWGALPTPGLR